jgi:hypothetical protein
MEQADDPDDPGGLPLYLGPYEYWNFGPGKGYAFQGIRKFSNYISALAELVPSQDGPEDEQADEPRAKVWLPTLWHRPGLTFVPFVVGKPFGEEVRNPKELQGLLCAGLRQVRQGQPRDIGSSRFRVAFPVPDAAMKADLDAPPSDPAWEPDAGLRGRIGRKRITIMAVIDDGMPFAHRNFRDKSGRRTRIEFCWLQSVTADTAQKSVLFGREYTRGQIEDYIARYGDDEDTLYREAGAAADAEDFGSLIDRHATHGAHVMDLAAGCAPEHGEDPAEEIRVIAVQLPNTIALDTSGFGKDMYMLSAFHYIFHRADIIAARYGIERPRLVINFSYGFSGGRHDGGTELEAAIHQLVAKRRVAVGPTALVLPAGNMFLGHLHGVVEKEDFVDDAATLHWRLQPNDRTPSYLELWFGEGFNPQGYTVELTDPSGRSRVSLPVGADAGTVHGGGDPRRVRPLCNDEGKQVGQVSADFHRGTRWRVLVVTAPSEPEDDRLPGIEAGKWTIVIRRGRDARPIDNPIHCWIQRDADPGALRSGSRQSYFEDSQDVARDDTGVLTEEDTEGAFVRRFGSLNGLATAPTSMVVAGFRLGRGLGSSLEHARPAPYSSAGTGQPGWPEAQVACSSMSDRSNVLPGTLAAGVRSGSRSFVQGTSTAAPFVARRLAAAFVTADDAAVERAAAENYRPLLSGWTGEQTDLTKARLGTVRVPPHWQPGLEP